MIGLATCRTLPRLLGPIENATKMRRRSLIPSHSWDEIAPWLPSLWLVPCYLRQVALTPPQVCQATWKPGPATSCHDATWSHLVISFCWSKAMWVIMIYVKSHWLCGLAPAHKRLSMHFAKSQEMKWTVTWNMILELTTVCCCPKIFQNDFLLSSIFSVLSEVWFAVLKMNARRFCER